MPSPFISSEAFMNTDEAAAMLGVRPKTLQRLARFGAHHRLPCWQAMEIPSSRLVGGCRRTSRAFEWAV